MVNFATNRTIDSFDQLDGRPTATSGEAAMVELIYKCIGVDRVEGFAALFAWAAGAFTLVAIAAFTLVAITAFAFVKALVAVVGLARLYLRRRGVFLQSLLKRC